MRTTRIKPEVIRTLLPIFPLLAILTVACGDDYSSPTEPRQGSQTVTIREDHSYSPDPVTARAGQALVWRNSDDETHHIVAADGSFDAGNTLAGYTSIAVMPTAGTHAYLCSRHPTMTGTVIVTQ